MKIADLVDHIALTTNTSKAETRAVLDELVKTITAAAQQGDEISLPALGKFKVKETPEREGRKPATGEKITIAASRKLTFTPARALKEALKASV
ncbi:histone-like DNA-binding protein HU [Neokomagataea thailandica NBRC 106555]|uniref:HU family DNA-binding protein n=2 Tax=Neokomagataea TaxID=1223423 RepID=A0A4Y6VBN2_9PROT|nr:MULTISPECIES: HU family DNA-binding protein [Neokomagataea]QDH26070.1 HU family DNA-binding protein [Neokomagataea tanensis]GBR55215.1 histone-like DNA-binding protein HU [Neokomagataea thailandica NBRC 106555]